MQQWSLYLLLALGAVIVFNFLRTRFGKPPELNVPAPNGKPLLIDVRQPFEYSSGHAVGAVNLPLGWVGRLADQLGAKDRPLAVYCRSGSRSGSAQRMLMQAGFTNVKDLGGVASVQRAGHRFE